MSIAGSDWRFQPFDYRLMVARGLVPGTVHVNKFGRNPAVVSGGTEEIWDGSSAYPWASILAVANITEIKQTSDQSDLRGKTIEVQGLDSSFAAVTQNATLDATNTTTSVVLSTALQRVFRMKVLASATCTDSIAVQSSGATVYGLISTGNNQTLMAIYTMPADKTGYITNYYSTVNPGGGAPNTLQIKLWARDNANSYAPQLKHTLGLNGDVDAYGRFQHYFDPYLKMTEQTDLYVDATTAGAAVDVSAGFDFYLVDN